MELGTLSEIFNDPTLNDFTENILNEIDVSDFKYIHADDFSDSTGSTTFPNSNDMFSMDIACNSSNQGTLEALLRSQNPPTCVPPAPDLHTNVGPMNHKGRGSVIGFCKDFAAQPRRNSLPIIKDLCQQNTTTTKVRKPSKKANLICDYLENCDDILSSSPAPISTHIENVHEFTDHPNLIRPQFLHGTPKTPDPFKPEFNMAKLKDSGIQDANNVSKAPKRSPHNAIEKRYRASINGRIDELRRILMPNPGNDTKSNKSSVLREAIERIRELEEKNRRLQAEVLALRSFHAVSKPKHYNGSPDSGLSLFEPSPSGSSSYSGHDGIDLTASTGISNYCGFITPANHTANDSVNATIIEAVEALDNSWPLSAYPEYFGTDTIYPIQTSPRNMNDSSQYQVTQNAMLPEANDLPGTETETQMGPSARQKRKARDSQQGSNKVHRPSEFRDEGPELNYSSMSSLIRPNSISKEPIYQPLIDSTPTGRELLLSSTAPGMDCASVKKDPDPLTEVEFNGGMAARTTLCLVALCLIALDPFVLSGNAEYPAVPSSPQGKSSPSRRLLSAFNAFGQESTPWTVWLVYVFQWVIALALCFWACIKRNSTPIRRRNSFDAAAVNAVWEEANKRIEQVSWSSAEEKLSACLVAMDPDTEALESPSKSDSLLPYFCNQVLQFIDGVALVLQTTAGVVLRLPRIMRISISKSVDFPASNVTEQSCTVGLTASHVRWRLLEVYLLAPKGCLKHSAILGQRFRFLNLLWTCLKEFLDDSISLLLSGCKDLKPMSEDLPRRGVLLVLVLNEFNAFALSKFTSGLRTVIQICIRRLAQYQSSSCPSLWHYLANNPILWQLSTERSGLNLHESLLGSSFSVNKTDQLEKSIRGALQQKLVDRCLRSIITNRGSDLHELEQSISTLIDLCSTLDKQSSPSPSTRSSAGSKSLWWAQFIQILWRNKRHDPDDLSQPDVVPVLPLPPQCVLQCTQTGLLAESAWLAFRPLSFSGTVLSAQKSGLVLCQYLKRISSHFSTESLNQCASVFCDTAIAPFWILACAHLTADHILSILARALIISKPCPVANSIQPPRLIESFNSSLWVLRHSSILLGSDQADWVVKKISYYETVRRLVSGANPVQSRFSMMHACRNTISRAVSHMDHRATPQSPRPVSLRRSPSESQLQVSLMRSENASRYLLLNTSPGQ